MFSALITPAHIKPVYIKILTITSIMLLAYPRGRYALGEFFSWVFAQLFWTIIGCFSCTNGLFPQWLPEGHSCNCPPPAVTDSERLKETLCDQGAPVGQEQIRNTTSFVITLLHCPSLRITGQKNGSWGSSPASTGPVWGSSFYLQIPITNEELQLPWTLVAIQKCTVTKGTRTTCSYTDPVRGAGSE